MDLESTYQLVQRFQRCKNYPKEDQELMHMAEALVSASNAYGVSVAAIVTECLDTSEWCPTDADLRRVAEALRASLPEPAAEKPWRSSRCPYGKCNGSGWISKQVWAKPAAMAGYWAWAAKRCQCHPPRDAPEPRQVSPKPSYYEKDV